MICRMLAPLMALRESQFATKSGNRIKNTARGSANCVRKDRKRVINVANKRRLEVASGLGQH